MKIYVATKNGNSKVYDNSPFGEATNKKYDGKPFGERTEELIQKEVKDFENWLRNEIFNNDFYHRYDDGYHPDDDALYQARLYDNLKKENDQLKEQLADYNEVNKKLQEVYKAYRKAKADNFFEEMGILDK